MNFREMVTGSDLTRQWQAIETRAGQLPTDYRAAWEQIKVRLFRRSDFTGRNLMPIFDAALELLEETAADGQSMREVLGEDIEGLCAALAGGAHVAGDYRGRWREQANRNVARKLGRLAG